MNALDEQIERQRQRVAATQEFQAATIGGPRRPDALNAAMVAFRRQSEVLDDLLARRTARDAAIAAHEQALEEHADDLVLLGQELDEERRALGERVTAAIDALAAAYAAAEGFDAFLAERSRWLSSVGLSAYFRPGAAEEARFAEGGATAGPSQPHLIVAGRRWERVIPRQVVTYVENAVLAGRQWLHERRVGPLYDLLDPVTRRPAPVPPRAPEAPKQSRLKAWAQ